MFSAQKLQLFVKLLKMILFFETFLKILLFILGIQVLLFSPTKWKSDYLVGHHGNDTFMDVFDILSGPMFNVSDDANNACNNERNKANLTDYDERK